MDRIVIGVDGSVQSDRALQWAVREAQLHSAAIELIHGYVIQPHRGLVGRFNREAAERTMSSVVKRNRGMLADVKWTATITPQVGASFATPLVHAGQEADLVVVGSRGLGGFSELVLGSASYRTAAHCPAPVAVIRDGQDPTTDQREIVVGVDESRAARRALRWAMDEARRRAVPLVIVHSYTAPATVLLHGVDSFGSPDVIQRSRRRAREAAAGVIDHALAVVRTPPGLQIERVVAEGSAAGALLHRAQRAALLVVGTRGHGLVGRMTLGSVSHQCLHHADGPMVVVP
jgi:nucleotide-binding universal stress UspA family protein